MMGPGCADSSSDEQTDLDDDDWAPKTRSAVTATKKKYIGKARGVKNVIQYSQ